MWTKKSPQLLNNQQAAEFLNVAPATLLTWRCRKTYEIPYLKIGGSVRYDVDDLVTWLESRKVHAGELQVAAR